jgi:SAM-dependent methyltransferase
MHDVSCCHRFDEAYFERGVSSGVSMYENYRWMPERSLKEAHWYVQHMGVTLNSMVLDFGCAKGFFVKAMRLLGYSAEGVDISEYAIAHCDPAVRRHVFLDSCKRYTHGFCKDVLEHCQSREDLLNTLKRMQGLANYWLIIVPLGDGEKYNVAEYEQDQTHVLRYTENQWRDAIAEAGLWVMDARSHMCGLKDNWAHHPDGNAFLRVSA